MGRRVRWDKVGPVDPGARGTPTSGHRIKLDENDVVVPCAQFWIQPARPCERGEADWIGKTDLFGEGAIRMPLRLARNL